MFSITPSGRRFVRSAIRPARSALPSLSTLPVVSSLQALPTHLAHPAHRTLLARFALLTLLTLLALLALLALPPARLAAQDASSSNSALTVVSGTVYDSLSGKPLAGALVQLVGRSEASRVFSTETDVRGEFRMAGVQRGQYFLGQLLVIARVNLVDPRAEHGHCPSPRVQRPAMRRRINPLPSNSQFSLP